MPTWRSRFTPNEVDPLFHHVKVGMTVIFQSKGAKVSMADVRRVSDHQGNAQNPPLFEVMDAYTGVISWISVDNRSPMLCLSSESFNRAPEPARDNHPDTPKWSDKALEL